MIYKAACYRPLFFIKKFVTNCESVRLTLEIRNKKLEIRKEVSDTGCRKAIQNILSQGLFLCDGNCEESVRGGGNNTEYFC